jgi:tryptophanyl-tRNA synthetase
MSKSATSPRGTVLVLDEPTAIVKKIRSAVTDSGTDVRYDREDKAGISNLLDLLAAATDRDIADVEDEFRGQGYGAFKSAVAEAVVELVRPIQARHRDLVADPAGVERLLRTGAERARARASTTLGRAKHAMGFLPPA